MTETQKTPREKEIDAMNDIYILLADGKLAYLTKEFYSSPERIIEQVSIDAYDKAQFTKRFFLSDEDNSEGVYPINLAGPAVTKVIPWNLAKNGTELKTFDNDNNLGTPKTGYFIDLRKLGMSRLNMVKIADDFEPKADTPIANDSLYSPKTIFLPVPEDQHYQLQQVPEANLYIAFFQQPDKTRTDSNCYSYCVSYITLAEVHNHLVPDQYTTKLQEKGIQYLETYYGNTQVQAGALNPYDIFPGYHHPDELEESALTDLTASFVMLGSGHENGGGIACFVANLRTFKK